MEERKKRTAQEIAALNDSLRRNGRPGKVVATSALRADPNFEAIMAAVREFDAFTSDNDPYGEHDCGLIKGFGDDEVMFKIDYYDESLEYGADPYEDGYIPVMTVMWASER